MTVAIAIYRKYLDSGQGLKVVQEFSARVGDKQLGDNDLLRFDETGKIFMARP